MSIQQNTANQIGDTILIVSYTPIFGIVSLTSYSDTILGETANSFFIREFSYSLDGLAFTDWITLNNLNLSNIVIQNTNSFYVNYRYTYAGTVDNVTLTFTEVFLHGVFDQPLCPNYFVLPKSIFKDFFCYNPQEAMLCAKLTKKCIDVGIIPLYVERPQVNDSDYDPTSDYIAFWNAVCCYFALILLFAERFENIDTDRELLLIYLQQRGFYFADSVSQTDLIYIKNNYYDEIRQRGTIQTFIKKGISNKAVDGEFLRFIGYKNTDEFINIYFVDQNIGWNLGNSSPCYMGVNRNIQSNHAPENSQDFVDLTKYDYVNINTNIFSDYPTSNKFVLRVISTINNGNNGIKYQFSDPTKLITIDPSLDYEVSFWVRSSSNSVDAKIIFGVDAFDVNNNPVDTYRIDTEGIEAKFFVDKQLNIRNKFYFIRGIIYNKDASAINSPCSQLNIGFGNNLKFSPNVAKIYPYIMLKERTVSPNSILDIWDYKITLCYTNFSRGFLNTSNLMTIFAHNNNSTVDIDQITAVTKKYLVPYSTNLRIVDLSQDNTLANNTCN